MFYVLYIYLGIFCLGCILMISGEIFAAPNERDPLSETILDIASLGVLLAGMLFLVLEVGNPLLRSIWMVAAPGAATVQLSLCLRDRKRAERKVSLAEHRRSFFFPDIGSLILTIPALAFNLYFAFGSHLPR